MSLPNRVDIEPAYIMHSRAYRETSQILEVFTATYGRVALVARGARRPKSPFRGILNPFQALKLSWSGRGDMPTLREADPAGAAIELKGENVLSGFYINELMIKLLERVDPHPNLFAHYSSLLHSLQQRESVELLLRRFELQLLYELGYELNLEKDAHTQEALIPDQHYQFVAERGVILADAAVAGGDTYTGECLLAIGRMDFSDRQHLPAAKRLLRTVLNFHLGHRALNTRRIASAMRRPG